MIAAQRSETIRSLGRGLAVLEVLSRIKFATASVIAAAAALPRPTVYRILETLVAAGYVQRAENSDVFQLTSALRDLSRGFEIDAEATGIGARLLPALSRSVVWPIDFATYETGEMVVRYSTHPTSPKSLVSKAIIGHRLPLLPTAPGLAFLAYLPREEIAPVLALSPGTPSRRVDGMLLRTLKKIRTRGYAYRDGGILPSTSSIAVPVLWRDRPVGCINLMFIRSALTIEKAAKLYLAEIQSVAAAIKAELQSRG